MSNQYRVDFPDFSITRLPLGRAAERLWLFFVVTGLPIARFDPQSTVPPWRIRDHVAVLINGVDVSPEESGGSTSEGLTLEHLVIRDVDASSLTIQYLIDGRVMEAEEVSIGG